MCYIWLEGVNCVTSIAEKLKYRQTTEKAERKGQSVKNTLTMNAWQTKRSSNQEKKHIFGLESDQMAGTVLKCIAFSLLSHYIWIVVAVIHYRTRDRFQLCAWAPNWVRIAGDISVQEQHDACCIFHFWKINVSEHMQWKVTMSIAHVKTNT